MSTSHTLTENGSFTLTDAKHLAAKVATDLKRFQRLYLKPSDRKITDYQEEVTQLLKEGYLGTVTYGFRQNGDWIEPTLECTARDLAGESANDDAPGKISAKATIDDVSFYSYLVYSHAWDRLPRSEKNAFRGRLRINRVSAPESGYSGYFEDDLTYSKGGRALDRRNLRSY